MLSSKENNLKQLPSDYSPAYLLYSTCLPSFTNKIYQISFYVVLCRIGKLTRIEVPSTDVISVTWID